MMTKIRKEEEANYSAAFVNGTTLRWPMNPSLPIGELRYPEFYDVTLNTKCDAKCPWCAMPDTLILMGDGGNKPIKDVRIGEEVTVFDYATNLPTIRPVDQLHVRPYSGELIELELENGRKLCLTPNHKVHTTRGEIPAGELTTEDTIIGVE